MFRKSEKFFNSDARFCNVGRYTEKKCQKYANGNPGVFEKF